MKGFIALFFILFTISTFAQHTGLIVGKVLDKDMGNAPLSFASVSIKGTSIKTTADISGKFLLENLKDGNYTLIYSFPGYKTKEAKVIVSSDKTTKADFALATVTMPVIETATVKSSGNKEAAQSVSSSLH